MRIRAEAEAVANRLLAEPLPQEPIEKEKIEKWDGKFPVIQGDTGTIVDLRSAAEGFVTHE